MLTARRRRRPTLIDRARTVVPVVLGLVIVVVALITVLGGSTTQHPRRIESMFQDDAELVYGSTSTVSRTLTTLKSLGVDRIRVTVKWADIAPDPGDQHVPADFNASIPNAPGYDWAYYDRLDLLANRDGIAVDFDLTAPAPLWADEANAHDEQVAESLGLSAAAFVHDAYVFGPSAIAFEQFVTAAGRRYSGSYTVALNGLAKVRLPRVSFWSVWNEPNQPGWLSPQNQLENGQWHPEAPELYRQYVDAAIDALNATGHGHDTVMIGELAPEGCVPGTQSAFCGIYKQLEQPIPPVPFIQSMYCLSASYQPLTGSAATAVGCSATGSRAAFVKANPGLFDATFWAHHPYSFILAPNVQLKGEPGDTDYVPLADLPRLETELDHVFGAYGVHRKIPIYLDEYGYETNPPDPTNKGQSLGVQSTYLNQAQYMAARNPRVAGLSQFLLVDSPPDARYPPTNLNYWDTFQTGLEFQDGQHKPSFASYALPIVLPDGGVAPAGRLRVWAMLRAAPNNTTQHAVVQWNTTGATAASFQTLQKVTTRDPDGIFSTTVHLPGSGQVRVQWVSAAGVVYDSRSVPVKVPG